MSNEKSRRTGVSDDGREARLGEDVFWGDAKLLVSICLSVSPSINGQHRRYKSRPAPSVIDSHSPEHERGKGVRQSEWVGAK